jgi:hypothetical protein
LAVGAYANTAIADIGIIGSEELPAAVTIFTISYPHREQSETQKRKKLQQPIEKWQNICIIIL